MKSLPHVKSLYLQITRTFPDSFRVGNTHVAVFATDVLKAYRTLLENVS